MRIPAALALIVLLALQGVRAEATPIVYDEAIDGPLSANTPLTMGVGTNIVIGSACWISYPFCATYNNFAFDIAPGTALVGYRYIFGNVVMATPLNNMVSAVDWTGRQIIQNVNDPGINSFTDIADWLLGVPQTLFIDDLFAPSGSYRQFYSAGRNGEGGIWDFRIELDVIAIDIPLPATALFFGLGLGLIGIVRRKRV